MRWSYKTVHYELKKEGILGSTFLDESEIELSLNEYGKSGWELVSMLETMDGLIAVFKQPLSLDGGYNSPVLSKPIAKKQSVEEPQVRVGEAALRGRDADGEDELLEDNDDLMLVEDFDLVEEEEKSEKRPLKDVDIGSIVIE